MKVECPNCTARYQVPEEKISSKGLPIQCTACETVFRVFPPELVEEEKVEQAPVEKIEERQWPSQDPGTSYPDEELDDDEFDEFKVQNRPSTKILVVVIGVICLIAVALYIKHITGEVFSTLDQVEDKLDTGEKVAKDWVPNPTRVFAIYGTGIANQLKDTDKTAREAKRIFAQVLAAEESHIGARARLAELDIITGMRSDAGSELAEQGCKEAGALYEKHSGDPNVLRALATCLLRLGRFEKAEQVAMESIRIKQDDQLVDGEGYLLRGRILSAAGNVKDAEEALEAAVKLNNQIFLTHHLLAQLAATKGKFDHAVQHETLAMQISPNHKEGREKLAKYRKKAGTKDDAPAEEPKDDWISKSKALRSQGKYSEALRALDSAIKENPGSTTAHNMKGRMLLESSPAKAAEHFEAAARSGSSEAYYFLGAAHQTAGNNAQAKAAYQAYMRSAPNGRFASEVRSILNRMSPPE
jgi:predicted Zn finger-like uncharacterized protein